MKDIDWSKAPEGSTHYLPESCSCHAVWVKSDGDVFLTWLASGDSQWDVDEDFEEERKNLIPRPATPWSGDGLPPVGTVCELSSQGSDWGIGTIQYTADNVVVWRWNNQASGQACACYKHEVSIRPIRTQAQIAAEEREAAIDEIENMIAGYTYHKCAELIYDAGYRKGESK